MAKLAVNIRQIMDETPGGPQCRIEEHVRAGVRGAAKCLAALRFRLLTVVAEGSAGGQAGPRALAVIGAWRGHGLDHDLAAACQG